MYTEIQEPMMNAAQETVSDDIVHAIIFALAVTATISE